MDFVKDFGAFGESFELEFKTISRMDTIGDVFEDIPSPIFLCSILRLRVTEAFLRTLYIAHHKLVFLTNVHLFNKLTSFPDLRAE